MLQIVVQLTVAFLSPHVHFQKLVFKAASGAIEFLVDLGNKTIVFSFPAPKVMSVVLGQAKAGVKCVESIHHRTIKISVILNKVTEFVNTVDYVEWRFKQRGLIIRRGYLQIQNEIY